MEVNMQVYIDKPICANSHTLEQHEFEAPT